MIKIGDFARIAGVSVPTLRHYDEEGLLSPTFVSPESGYRYYSVDQLRYVHRILVLKGLGLSLPEVRRMLDKELDVSELRQLLDEKRGQAEARLESELAQIHRIESRIATLEKEQTMPELEVIRKIAPAMRVAAIRLEIPSNDLVSGMLGKAYDELFGALHMRKIQPKGPAMALWYSTPDMHTDEVVDAAVEISAHSLDAPPIRVELVPETEVASVVHTGPFSEFQQCHIALSEWLAENGYRLEGAYREIYHTCPGEKATTEVQYPIAKD